MRLILTAHPDDEVLFFLPLMQSLEAQRTPFLVACMTCGDWNGHPDPQLGQERAREMEKVHSLLGLHYGRFLCIPSSLAAIQGLTVSQALAAAYSAASQASLESDVKTPDQDNPAELASLLLLQLLDSPRLRLNPQACVSALKLCVPEWRLITHVYTYDSDGVSGHPQHIDCHLAAELLCRELCTQARARAELEHSRSYDYVADQDGSSDQIAAQSKRPVSIWYRPPLLYELCSPPLALKYTMGSLWRLCRYFWGDLPDYLLVASDDGVELARAAMRDGYKTQWGVLRGLYVFFSSTLRYSLFRNVRLSRQPQETSGHPQS